MNLFKQLFNILVIEPLKNYWQFILAALLPAGVFLSILFYVTNFLKAHIVLILIFSVLILLLSILSFILFKVGKKLIQQNKIIPKLQEEIVELSKRPPFIDKFGVLWNLDGWPLCRTHKAGLHFKSFQNHYTCPVCNKFRKREEGESIYNLIDENGNILSVTEARKRL